MKPFVSSVAVLALSWSFVQPADAVEILANGGFETGFTGWTRADGLGGDGSFSLQNGTLSPINGDPVPAPPGGVNAAMTDAGGPGSHVLYQDFTISSLASQLLLTFDLFIGNRSDMFATPNPANLDFGINAANQQVRVDIMRGTAGAFSVAAGDVLLNLYQSQAGDPLVAGYATYSFDLTALLNANLGTTLRLRFAETDNLAPLQAGVDNVSLASVVATVPEPSTSLLLLASGCMLGLMRLMRRKARR